MTEAVPEVRLTSYRITTYQITSLFIYFQRSYLDLLHPDISIYLK